MLLTIFFNIYHINHFLYKLIVPDQKMVVGVFFNAVVHSENTLVTVGLNGGVYLQTLRCSSQ